MTDLFAEALNNTKDYSEFDINLAIICSQLSYQSYQTSAEQLSFLNSYNFQNIQLINVQDAYATLVCYGDDLYVAIKGTNFQNIEDILTDADIVWTEEGVGRVHLGYKTHLDLIWPQILNYINSTPHKNLIITGHSMGGACGQLTNYRIPTSIGYYFGSTRTVDNAIKKDMVNSLVYQIQHQYDIVTRLPLPILGFERIGKVYTIQNNQLVPTPDSWKNFFYSIVYTIAYFFLSIYAKIANTQDHLTDLIVQQHEILGYYNDIMSCSCLQANQT